MSTMVTELVEVRATPTQLMFVFGDRYHLSLPINLSSTTLVRVTVLLKIQFFSYTYHLNNFIPQLLAASSW